MELSLEERLQKYLNEHPNCRFTKNYYTDEKKRKDILERRILREYIKLERQAEIARKRKAGLTLQAIGSEQGITKERVRQIILGI